MAISRRKVDKDIRDLSKWIRCRLKSDVYEVKYWESGTIYVNTRDMEKYKASPKTPIVFCDSSNVYWTVSVKTLLDDYLLVNGEKITQSTLLKLKQGDTIKVMGNPNRLLWAFHVYTDIYGWNCAYGANRPNTYRGNGDYLVCPGRGAPSLKEAKAVHTVTFNQQYTTEEGEQVFEFRDSMWFCGDKEFENATDALVELCNAITWSAVDFSPEFGDLGMFVPYRLALVYAIYKLDMSLVLTSATHNKYTKESGKDSVVLKNFEGNPFYSRSIRVTEDYKSNKRLQCVIFPKLEDAYKAGRRMTLACQKIECSYEIALSFLCDTLLFNAKDSPFTEAMQIFLELEKHDITRDLENTCAHADLSRLRILALQLACGDVTQEEPITIDQVRRCSYACKTLDSLDPKVDYAEMLILSPPALMSDNFTEWSSRVLELQRTVDEVVELKPEPLILPEPKAVDEIEKVPFMNPPEPSEDTAEMQAICTTYCEFSGVDIDQCREILRSMGVVSDEDFYKAVPVYLRRIGKGVHESILLEYCSLLQSTYGDCTLRFGDA